MKKLFLNSIWILALLAVCFTACEEEVLELEEVVETSIIENRSSCSALSYRVSEDGCCYNFIVTAGGNWTIHLGDGTSMSGSGNEQFQHCYTGQSMLVRVFCDGEFSYSYSNGGCKVVSPDKPDEDPCVQAQAILDYYTTQCETGDSTEACLKIPAAQAKVDRLCHNGDDDDSDSSGDDSLPDCWETGCPVGQICTPSGCQWR